MFDGDVGGIARRGSVGAGGLSTGCKLHISNLDFGVTDSDIQVQNCVYCVFNPMAYGGGAFYPTPP